MTKNAGRKAQSITKTIESKQEEAYKGIKETKGEGERKLGIVFAVPRIPHSEISDIVDRLFNWQKQVFALSTSSMAWVFPSVTRNLYGDDSYIYPGVAVLIQEV